jgi:hypothetical protein
VRDSYGWTGKRFEDLEPRDGWSLSDPTEEEPEYEYAFCHLDLRPTDECSGGHFHKRIMFHKEERFDDFYCCDKCGMLMTLKELVTLAAETYSHDWESHCKTEVAR